jgi:hypothetical protein
MGNRSRRGTIMARKPKKDDDPASQNPTGFQRRGSSGQRRKQDRKLYGDTPWQKPKDPPKGK